MSSPRLSEIAVDLVIASIKAGIGQALTDVLMDRDSRVTLEVPSPESYFIYPKAHGYRCPVIFVIDGPMDMRKAEMKANYVSGRLQLFVTVKVEDRDLEAVTRKAWRYQAALFKVLELSNLANSDNTVKLNLKVRDIKPSDLYTQKTDDPDSQASFYKEYQLELDVDHSEKLL